MPEPAKPNKFWSVKTESAPGGKTAGHLYLYGLVSAKTWWGDEVTPKQFVDDLQALGDIDTLYVHIFSDGGDVFAGNAIYSILKQQKAEVIAYIEGIAASMATIIPMAAAKIYVSRNAFMMIHRAMLGLCGYYNIGDLMAMQQDLKKISEPLIATYQSRTGKSREEIEAIMEGEDGQGTWFNAQEAIDAGLADGFIPAENEIAHEAVACISPDVYQWNGFTFDLSAYKEAPNIANRRQKGMAKKIARKKAARVVNNAAKPKAELVEVTCPECGVVLEVDSAGSEATEDKLHITCPECGEEFDVEVAQAETDDEQEGETRTVARRKTKAKRAQKAKGIFAKLLRPKAELVNITCPECGETFEADDAGADEEGLLDATCPECGAQFAYTIEGEALENDALEEPQAKGMYGAGVKAERQRIAELDSILTADPDSVDVVAQAKAEGWSYEQTSRKVFEDIQGRAKGGYLAKRVAEVHAGNGMKVKAAPGGGTVKNTAQAKAVNMIVAGFKGKKERDLK